MNDNILKVYFDAEFTGLHKDTKLISIGLVTEKIDMFYAEVNDLNYKVETEPHILLNKNDVSITPWIEENVINKLLFNDSETIYMSKDIHEFKLVFMKDSFENISIKINEWLKSINPNNKKIQFYCDCGYFDMVLLIDLITNHKTSLDLPENISYIPIDLCSILQYRGYDPDLNRIGLMNTLHDNPTEIKSLEIELMLKKVFKEFFEDKIIIPSHGIEHNSLFDAIVIEELFITI